MNQIKVDKEGLQIEVMKSLAEHDREIRYMEWLRDQIKAVTTDEYYKKYIKQYDLNALREDYINAMKWLDWHQDASIIINELMFGNLVLNKWHWMKEHTTAQDYYLTQFKSITGNDHPETDYTRHLAQVRRDAMSPKEREEDDEIRKEIEDENTKESG